MGSRLQWRVMIKVGGVYAVAGISDARLAEVLSCYVRIPLGELRLGVSRLGAYEAGVKPSKTWEKPRAYVRASAPLVPVLDPLGSLSREPESQDRSQEGGHEVPGSPGLTGAATPEARQA